jgi:hypothetical protein
MADALTCIKDPDEKMSEFNNRLKAECDKFEPTKVVILVVDGEPMVTLMSETVEADEEDVADAKEHGATIEDEGKERPIQLGDEIPAGDIVSVKVVKVAGYELPKTAVARKGSPTEGMSISQISEERLDKLYTEANGLITEHILASGPALAPAYPGQQVHYVGVVYVPVEDEEEEDRAAAEGESALKG